MKSMNTSLTPQPPATEPAVTAPTAASAPAPGALTPRSLLKQILAIMPDLDRKTMRTALGIHTGSLRYLKVMEKAKVRHDLDGKPGAEVTDTHRAHATQVLQERFKKEAERKKAEREAAAAEEAARVRADKLNQLTAKFSRKG
jgi:ProP effector